MRKWFRSRSLNQAAAILGLVVAIPGALIAAAEGWPNTAEAISALTLGLASAGFVYAVCAWIFLRIVARSRSPSRAAVTIGFVGAALGTLTNAIQDWPNMAEIAGGLTIGLVANWIFLTVCAWLVLRIAALVFGKWWEAEETT
jgi:hypothetical protein